MKWRMIAGVVLVVAVGAAIMGGMNRFGKAAGNASPVLAKVSGDEIRVDEFEQGFVMSAFAARSDQLQARREYLDMLINHRLILLDAQAKNIDKDPDFLRSVERFWAQSLLTVALGQKTMELSRGVVIRDDDVRRIYENMIKDGVTEKPFDEVYPQIKWQAEKQLETQLLTGWIDGLRRSAVVSVDENVLKALK